MTGALVITGAMPFPWALIPIRASVLKNRKTEGIDLFKVPILLMLPSERIALYYLKAFLVGFDGV